MPISKQASWNLGWANLTIPRRLRSDAGGDSAPALANLLATDK